MTIREMMAMYHSLQFVEELIDYIEEYPDDDYMTMECLCRKLDKYHLMSKVDGYYTADRKTEPQRDEFELFDREALILLIECQRERIAELLAKTEPQYDFSEYADRLWKIAYERGKREAEQTEPKTERSEE